MIKTDNKEVDLLEKSDYQNSESLKPFKQSCISVPEIYLQTLIAAEEQEIEFEEQETEEVVLENLTENVAYLENDVIQFIIILFILILNYRKISAIYKK